MVLRHVAVEGAYAVLGLENGASVDEVKSAYKKLAMRTHPDRNLDVPDATQKFQEVGAAYNTIMKHFDRSQAAPPQYAPWQQTFESDEDEYSYDSDEYYDDDEPDDLDFFMFIFDELLRGRSSRAHMRYSTPHRTRAPETEEQYQERLRRNREGRKAARERRAMDEQRRKERIKEENERDRLAAEMRQKQRLTQKKAQAEASRKDAAEKVRSQQERSQNLRSAVFAAARQGDAEKVKKGIWEDDVDASGGEVRRGSEVFVPKPPKDAAETLLHIAANQGDAELVEWLVNHNAEPDERNSFGLTAFHLALRKGYLPVVQYFFKHHPHKDDDYRNIYTTPTSHSLLRFSIDSFEPELVWMILENGLASKKDISDAWSWVCSCEGESALRSSRGKQEPGEQRFEEIQNLLMAYGGFTPPPTPKVNALNVESKSNTDTRAKRASRPTINSRMSTPRSPILQNPTPSVSPAPSDSSYQTSPTKSDGTPRSFFLGRGRGRGRGRGSVRGRGTGRGGHIYTTRNQAPVA